MNYVDQEFMDKQVDSLVSDPITLQEQINSVYNQTAGEFVIFAAQPFTTEQVLEFFAKNKVNIRVVLGSYKGTTETSFIMPFEYMEALVKSGLIDNQESLMILSNVQKNGTRCGYLAYREAGTVEYLGQIGEIAEDSLPDAYTYDPTAGLYYGVVSVVEQVA